MEFLKLGILCLLSVTLCSAEVVIHPASQKILAGSPVVFTCKTSLPGGTLEWLKSNKQIDEKRDFIRVEQISDVISVLRIDNADIKRHKRLYTCVNTFSDSGRVDQASTKLKVMQFQKLHKSFPHISGTVETSDLSVPQEHPAKLDITCNLVDQTSTNLNVKWRWIKDDVIDVSFTEEFIDGRLELITERNGVTLRIKEVSGEDSGSYVCAADNNRGNAYGTPVKVQIRTEKLDGCMTENSTRVPVGAVFNKGGDPCTTCECLEGGVMRCKSVGCVLPAGRTCADGEVFRMSNTTCCEFDCFPVAVRNDTCLDRDSRRVARGDLYKPEEDPCVQCICAPGEPESCMTVACARPTCDNYIPSRDVCCNYTCPPDLPTPPGPSDLKKPCRDSKGNIIPDGERFFTPHDPCLSCRCSNGKEEHCYSVICDAPPCRDYELIPGTCCGFRCLGEEGKIDDVEVNIDGRNDTCLDRDSRRVARGDLYKPREDPCVQCRCAPGEHESCVTVVCDRPTCDNYIPSRNVCCNYTCPPVLPTPPGPSNLKRPCMDIEGNTIPHGEIFHSPDDPCLSCRCSDGVQELCATVICDSPPCRDYELIPGTCCGFRCLGDEGEIDEVEVNIDGSCVGYGGKLVPDGELFQPGPDPCVSCVCENGKGGPCRSVACISPGRHCRLEPGTCCSWNCNNSSSLTDLERVLGRLYVRQVGANRAIVQWKLPPGNEELLEKPNNLTAYVTHMGPYPYVTTHTNAANSDHVILYELMPNNQYDIIVNGTVGGMGRGSRQKYLVTRSTPFKLDGRASSSLDLSVAIGQVFESRGSVAYDGYSIPRKFEPVVKSFSIRNYVNVDSFHRVEASIYAEDPCPNDECGLLRFFVYSLDGECINVMSLMFSSQQDYIWAKAHL